MSGGPRDQEERRLLTNVVAVTPTARDIEEQRLRPNLTVPTPLQQARDIEEKRLAQGQR